MDERDGDGVMVFWFWFGLYCTPLTLEFVYVVCGYVGRYDV